MTATTFDLVRKVNNTLSGGNLVATSTGAGGVGTSRGAQQNFYFEVTLTTLTGTPRVGISSLNAPQTTSLENALYCLGYDASGAVKINNVTIATIATFAQGNRIDCAVNLPLRLIWFRVAGGNWNNNVANDPATNTGGIDWSSMTLAATMQAAVSASLTGTVWTAVFSAAGWAGAAPAGYVSLDSINANTTTNGLENHHTTPVASDFAGAYKTIAQLTTQHCKRFQPAGTIKTVSGVIRELGVVVPGKRIDVYNRNSGELIGTTTSDGAGAWSVPTLDQTKVRVVATDAYNYNSLAADNVTPA